MSRIGECRLIFASVHCCLFQLRRGVCASTTTFFSFKRTHTHQTTTPTTDNTTNTTHHIVAEMIEQSAPVKSSKHSQIPTLKSHVPLPEHTRPLSPPFHPNGSSPLGHSTSEHEIPRFPISHFIPNIRPESQLP